ncbi:hypothetical protein RCL1_002414 [Eukaryota sp. TZLM3-RCL]
MKKVKKEAKSDVGRREIEHPFFLKLSCLSREGITVVTSTDEDTLTTFVATIVLDVSLKFVLSARSHYQDKAIKRFQVRNIVETAGLKDIQTACAFESYRLPKTYNKVQYCVSCAVHNHTVRVRSHENRRIRANPQARPQRDTASRKEVSK